MSAVLETFIPITAAEEPQTASRVVLHPPQGAWSDEEFLALCRVNGDLKLERNGNGDLLIMTPGDLGTSYDNADIVADLIIWNRRTRGGRVSESSGTIALPNGARYTPDATWVRLERWNALTSEQREFPSQIVPDFVLELMSPSDRLSDAQAKMREYRDNGVLLGWLVNPKKRQVEVYELGKEAIILDNPTAVSGEPVLRGFVLNLTEIWK